MTNRKYIYARLFYIQFHLSLLLHYHIDTLDTLTFELIAIETEINSQFGNAIDAIAIFLECLLSQPAVTHVSERCSKISGC